MGIGFCMTVAKFVGADDKTLADEIVSTINAALVQHGLPQYSEPDVAPDVYERRPVGNRVQILFGRSALDHSPVLSFCDLAKIAVGTHPSPQLELLCEHSGFLAYLPIYIPNPLRASYTRSKYGYPLHIGSASALLAELVLFAPKLGIPLAEGALSTDVADKINDYLPLTDGEDVYDWGDERGTWLLAYEGARLAMQNHVALVVG